LAGVLFYCVARDQLAGDRTCVINLQRSNLYGDAVRLGLGAVANESNASNEGGDRANHPAVDGGLLRHERERVHVPSGVAINQLALCNKMVEPIAEGNDRGEGVLDFNGADAVNARHIATISCRVGDKVYAGIRRGMWSCMGTQRNVFLVLEEYDVACTANSHLAREVCFEVFCANSRVELVVNLSGPYSVFIRKRLKLRCTDFTEAVNTGAGGLVIGEMACCGDSGRVLNESAAFVAHNVDGGIASADRVLGGYIKFYAIR